MTQITKRILALLMALAMLFAVAGCGDTDTESTPTTSSDADDGIEDVSGVSDDDFFGDSVTDIDDDVTTSQASQSQSTSDSSVTTNKPSSTQNANYWKEMLKNMPDFSGTTIQVYNWNAQEEYPGLANVIKSFTKATGVTVKWVREDYSTYLQKLTSLIATKKSPDIIRTNQPLPHVWTLSQDISVSGYEDFGNEVWDQKFMSYHTVNGKVYATNTTSSIMTGPQILFYNRSLISKYNLDDPYKLWKSDEWTVDAFEKILRDYKKASGNVAIGCDLIDKYLTNIYNLPGEISYDATTNKFVPNIDNKNIITVMQRAADLANKENLSVGWGLDEFDRGDILMFAGTGVTARRLNAYATNLKSAGTLGTVPWPTASGKNSDAVVGWGDEAYAIPKGAKNPEIFPYYVFYVTDPSRYDLKTFFADDQALEVYNFLTDLPASQRSASLGWSSNIEQFIGDISRISSAYSGKTGDQIPSVLNSNSNLSQLRADEYNKVLANVGK